MIAFDDFQELVGNDFQADTEAGPVALRLTEVVALGPNGDTNSFSLTFTSDANAPIGQSTYQLSAAGFGPEAVFLVPIGVKADRAEHQAVFHRLPE